MKTNTIHYDYCPLCHGADLTLHMTATDHLVSGLRFDIVRCRTCGFLFTQDAPTPDAIDPFYESMNYQPHNDGRGLVSMAYRRVRSLMLCRKGALIHGYHKQRGVLIDVGAGSGHFMAYMRHQGWQVMGCEQSERARDEAWQRDGLRLDGDVMSVDYPQACADVITAWHAMEHIHDLHRLWDSLNKWLKADGLLVVAVPNSQSLDARHYGNHWAAWDVPRHLWHFSAATMESLGMRHGFNLVATNALLLDACYIAMLSDHSKFKALVSGFRFTLQGAFHPQQASSLIYLFQKTDDGNM